MTMIGDLPTAMPMPDTPNLPVCALCGTAPQMYGRSDLARCGRHYCTCASPWLKAADWTRLHSRPKLAPEQRAELAELAVSGRVGTSKVTAIRAALAALGEEAN